MLNYKKEVWEGWTVQDFIDSLQTEIAMIMGGSSYLKPFKSKEELEAYIISNQWVGLTADNNRLCNKKRSSGERKPLILKGERD